ncbi:MAG: type I-U CRISPR-associated protein Cas5/Cas6 [Opitutales bacterium]|nr:type I-U CRISPR-associated protein Cas5/Cas6 [Opitutales bacterium]
MCTIKIELPWGRYYAHPWGINPVRLKEAEWPPSPWRLLRAIAAAWFQQNPGNSTDDNLGHLLEQLGSALPELGFQRIAFGHTAHWQPNYGAADTAGKASFTYKKTRHENHFVAVSSPIFFRWPNLELTTQQAQLLATILPHISYFGRAESICQMSLENNIPNGLGWAIPCLQDGRPIRKMGEDCRDVFCPDPEDFQVADLWSLRESRPPSWENQPQNLVDQILSKQLLPDGACWVTYQMPQGWPNKWIVRVPKSEKPKRLMSAKPIAHTLRFSLECRIGIPLKATVDVAELFRQSAIKRFKQTHGADAHSFALSGHEPKPEGVSGDHQHAHFLPLPEGVSHSGNISELYVWAPSGLTQVEIEALMQVKTLHWGASKHPIRPVLTAIDQQPPSFLSQKPAKIWQSLTPFVPPRHFYRGNLHGAKLKQKDSPENQLAKEIERLGIETPFAVSRIPLNRFGDRSETSQCYWDIVRTPGEAPAFEDSMLTDIHSNRNAKERRIGFMFDIQFEQPVSLVRPLGHSSHFGLGLFAPVIEK